MANTDYRNPTRRQFVDFSKLPREDGPFVMVNLLKFKKEKNADGETGAEIYERYMEQMEPMLKTAGARPRYAGSVDMTFIGDPEVDAWDKVLLVQYPSRQAFRDMVTKPEYAGLSALREAAVEKTVLLAVHKWGED